MLDAITCFVEEFTTHCLQRLLPQDVIVTEIPRAARVEVMPERFSLTLAVGGLARWAIAYHMTTLKRCECWCVQYLAATSTPVFCDR